MSSPSPEQAAVVTVERDGYVLLVGIDRPAKRNAWDLAVIEQVSRALDRVDDEDVRACVLFGHGAHFSAGLDLPQVLSAIAAHGPAALGGSGRYDPFGLFGEPLPVPVVLAVQGIAFTLSIELALASDIVVCAADVRFRQLEVGRGIMPFGGATVRGPRQLGWGNSMRFLLTAGEFGANEALRIGLVQEVVPAGRQLERATELAQLIALQAPLGVRETLVSARLAARTGEGPAREHLREVMPRLTGSDDAAEGVRSFVERREAVFTGR